MTRGQSDKAMEIIVRYSTTRIGINMSEEGPANNVGKDALRLHITECRPSVINRLISADYTLSMTPEGLYVDKTV